MSEQVLNQFSVDALNRPIIAGPIEATAIGNMLMQMIAKGDVRTLAEGRAMISKSFESKVIMPENTAAWDKAFERFVAIS